MPSMNKKLTYRQGVLLSIVVEATERDASGALTSYFVPSAYHHWSKLYPRDMIYVRGTDSASLRALEKRGLIEHVGDETYGPFRYYFAATEDGVLAYEQLRAETSPVDKRDTTT